MTLGPEMAIFAAYVTLFVPRGAVGLQVVRGAAAVALRSRRASGFQVTHLSAVVTSLSLRIRARYVLVTLDPQVPVFATNVTCLILRGAVGFQVRGGATARALGVIRTQAPDMSFFAAVVTNLALRTDGCRGLVALGPEVADFAAHITCLVPRGAVSFHVVSGSATIALRISLTMRP